MKLFYFAIALVLTGCSGTALRSTESINQTTIGATAGNQYDLSNDAYTVNSTQPHSGTDLSPLGMSAVIPGPANVQGLKLTEMVTLFSGNPAESRIDKLILEFGERGEDGQLPVKSLTIEGYSTDAPAAIIAEASRLEVLTPFLIQASEDELQAFITAVQEETKRQGNLLDAITTVAPSIFPGL